MELTSILLGQVVRLLKADSPIGGIYMPMAVQALKDRYGFVQVPTVLQDFDLTKGITLSHGRFVINSSSQQREIVIYQLQIYDDGVVVSTQADIDDANLFVDDFINWSIKAYGSKIDPRIPIQSFYNSHVEFHSDISLDDFFPGSSEIGKGIVGALESYGQKPLPFQVSSVSLYIDTTQTKAVIPGSFTLARREKVPFSTNLYFSSAPLKTKDHLALLGKIENLASAKASPKSKSDSGEPKRSLIL